MEPEPDPKLYEQINSLTQPGRERSLKEMQPGPWDTVHVFEEYTSKEQIERTIGTGIGIDDYTGPGQLFFFMSAGKVFRAVELDASRVPGGTYSSGVVLRGGPIPGGVRLEVVDPK
ncbi:hypothetical protein [Saccharopolyspora erythraea]|uniref:Uncharacterized protein n=1 Tax=Saccharopolyspora erythraea (strain ATCC 11635 / DSM 40517 / JCM 4748 / NBRC 13426 / NCIMB 8594 / NRRL 2338) TaxID=405948 RepID=A4FML5_SACEN|nr:hypothetical protein [Saccharopolyspora erythraea]QRK88922.1 hypothetical protein JQX30_30645 [Saccharopolyspora erythraea]CAM05290.1 hypothetical protein SACE_6117 [Saccharopolyspora erythraea NRRL 2338]